MKTVRSMQHFLNEMDKISRKFKVITHPTVGLASNKTSADFPVRLTPQGNSKVCRTVNADDQNLKPGEKVQGVNLYLKKWFELINAPSTNTTERPVVSSEDIADFVRQLGLFSQRHMIEACGIPDGHLIEREYLIGWLKTTPNPQHPINTHKPLGMKLEDVAACLVFQKISKLFMRCKFDLLNGLSISDIYLKDVAISKDMRYVLGRPKSYLDIYVAACVQQKKTVASKLNELSRSYQANRDDFRNINQDLVVGFLRRIFSKNLEEGIDFTEALDHFRQQVVHVDHDKVLAFLLLKHKPNHTLFGRTRSNTQKLRKREESIVSLIRLAYQQENIKVVVYLGSKGYGSSNENIALVQRLLQKEAIDHDMDRFIANTMEHAFAKDQAEFGKLLTHTSSDGRILSNDIARVCTEQTTSKIFGNAQKTGCLKKLLLPRSEKAGDTLPLGPLMLACKSDNTGSVKTILRLANECSIDVLTPTDNRRFGWNAFMYACKYSASSAKLIIRDASYKRCFDQIMLQQCQESRNALSIAVEFQLDAVVPLLEAAKKRASTRKDMSTLQCVLTKPPYPLFIAIRCQPSAIQPLLDAAFDAECLNHLLRPNTKNALCYALDRSDTMAIHIIKAISSGLEAGLLSEAFVKEIICSLQICVKESKNNPDTTMSTSECWVQARPKALPGLVKLAQQTKCLKQLMTITTTKKETRTEIQRVNQRTIVKKEEKIVEEISLFTLLAKTSKNPTLLKLILDETEDYLLELMYQPTTWDHPEWHLIKSITFLSIVKDCNGTTFAEIIKKLETLAEIKELTELFCYSNEKLHSAVLYAMIGPEAFKVKLMIKTAIKMKCLDTILSKRYGRYLGYTKLNNILTCATKMSEENVGVLIDVLMESNQKDWAVKLICDSTNDESDILYSRGMSTLLCAVVFNKPVAIRAILQAAHKFGCLEQVLTQQSKLKIIARGQTCNALKLAILKNNDMIPEILKTAHSIDHENIGTLQAQTRWFDSGKKVLSKMLEPIQHKDHLYILLRVIIRRYPNTHIMKSILERANISGCLPDVLRTQDNNGCNALMLSVTMHGPSAKIILEKMASLRTRSQHTFNLSKLLSTKAKNGQNVLALATPLQPDLVVPILKLAHAIDHFSETPQVQEESSVDKPSFVSEMLKAIQCKHDLLAILRQVIKFHPDKNIIESILKQAKAECFQAVENWGYFWEISSGCLPYLLHEKDEDGRTPLMLAAGIDCAATKVILDSMALYVRTRSERQFLFAQTDNDHQNVLEIAENNHDNDVVELLKQQYTELTGKSPDHLLAPAKRRRVNCTPAS